MKSWHSLHYAVGYKRRLMASSLFCFTNQTSEKNYIYTRSTCQHLFFFFSCHNFYHNTVQNCFSCLEKLKCTHSLILGFVHVRVIDYCSLSTEDTLVYQSTFSESEVDLFLASRRGACEQVRVNVSFIRHHYIFVSLRGDYTNYFPKWIR